MKAIYSLIGAAILILAAAQASAQSPGLGLSWEEIGPSNQGNHIRALEMDANGVLWAGSAGGGLWKTSNRGLSWQGVPGFEDNMAVSCLASDGNLLYAGTGELALYRAGTDFISNSANWTPASVFTWQHGFFQYAGLPGEGVFVSTDGGGTWSHSNGTWNGSSTFSNNPFTSIQSIERSGQRTLIASLEGLYYSDDVDLANVTQAIGSAHFMDNPVLDIAVGASGRIFAATKDSIFLSDDNGATFTTGLNDRILPSAPQPALQVGGNRIGLAASPSNPNWIYVTGALSTNNNCSGVFRSTDNGQTFQRIGPLESSSFRPFQNNGRYAMVLEVDPSTPEHIILGGQAFYEYSDGKGWTNTVSHNYIGGVTTNYVPLPVLSATFDPADPQALFIGGDKRIVATYDGGQTYTFKIKGLNSSHLQAISVNPFDEIVASDRFSGMLYKESISTNPYQQEFVVVRNTARGGIGRFSLTNPQYLITQNPDGGLSRSSNSGASYKLFWGPPLSPLDSCLGTDDLYIDRPTALDSSQGLQDIRVAPVNPWTLDEYIPASSLGSAEDIQNSPAYLYLASGNFLWTCTNPFGEVDSVPYWTRISLDLIEGTLQDQEFFTALEVSGDQDHVLYAGTNYGKLYRIFGANDPLGFSPCTDVERLDSSTGLPQAWISDIAVDPGDPQNVLLTFGGYAANPARVWISNDGKTGASSFRDISANLPQDLPVYTAAFAPASSGQGIVIGTEKGVYGTGSDYTDPNAALNWVPEQSGLGGAPVYDLVFRAFKAVDLGFGDYAYAVDNSLFAATYGRGAFRTQTLVSTAPTIPARGAFSMHLAPNPMDQGGKIALQLEESARVALYIYGIEGRLVDKIAERKLPAGAHELDLETALLPAGIYLVELRVKQKGSVFRKALRAVVAH